MAQVAEDSSLGWYNEVVSPGFNPSNVNPFVFSYDAGHYTQVVWAETEEIGCGFSYYAVRLEAHTNLTPHTQPPGASRALQGLQGADRL